jgi:hypothetical protein
MIVSEYERARASSECGAQDDSDVDGPDEMLASDSGDMGSGDAIVPVDEEACEVLAVSEADERVEGAGCAWRVGDAFFREAKGTAGLHEAHFVDGDGVSLLASEGLDGFHGGSASFG